MGQLRGPFAQPSNRRNIIRPTTQSPLVARLTAPDATTWERVGRFTRPSAEKTIERGWNAGKPRAECNEETPQI